MSAYTYFISSAEDERALVKIGSAHDVDRRMMTLQIGSPVRLSLLGKSCLLRERWLHFVFKNYRVRGEWFQRSAGLEALIRALPKINYSGLDSDQAHSHAATIVSAATGARVASAGAALW